MKNRIKTAFKYIFVFALIFLQAGILFGCGIGGNSGGITSNMFTDRNVKQTKYEDATTDCYYVYVYYLMDNEKTKEFTVSDFSYKQDGVTKQISGFVLSIEISSMSSTQGGTTRIEHATTGNSVTLTHKSENAENVWFCIIVENNQPVEAVMYKGERITKTNAY